MKKQWKNYTPIEKIAILRGHLLEKEPILKLCLEKESAAIERLLSKWNGKPSKADDRDAHRDHPARREGEVPGSAARIISDNGPRFIAKDFKEFIRISGMTHVRTSPFYPQSNVGTNRSKGSASGRERRCRSMTRVVWCRDTWTAASTCA